MKSLMLMELMKKCYEDYTNGMSYAEIASRRGLKSRSSAAGYIFRYRALNNLPPKVMTPRQHLEAVAKGKKRASKTRKKNGKGNPEAYRNTRAPVMEEGHSDLVVTIREDGVRITRDTKPRMAWGCGYDWKGV